MRIRPTGRRSVRWAFLTALLVLLPVEQALAVGCLLSPAKLPDAALSAFKNKPNDLLDRYPGGGPAMSAEIMRHVGSDVSLLPDIIELARKGGTAHRVAIGIGLAKAATVCERTHPGIQQAIKDAVAGAGLSELAAAFAAGFSSVDLSAVSPGGASSSGGSLISSGPSASFGGSSQSTTPGPGGPAVAPTVLLVVPLQTRFLSKGLTSTSGNTVSPTRP